MVDLTNPANLLQVLHMLSANDTATVKNAEKALKPFLKQSSSAVLLIQVLRTCEDIAVRHHAALLLKKKVGNYYPKYNASQQASLKSELLNMLLTEPNGNVGTGIAGVVAVTAKAIFKAKQQWPELFQMLLQLAQDPNERLRSLNFKLLAELAEQIPEHLKPHSTTLAQLFGMGCQDAVQSVASSALTATANYILVLGNVDEVMTMSTVISPMIAVMTKCLQSGDEDLVIEGLDVLQECCVLEQPLINDHIETVVHFAISIIQNQDLDASVKKSAAQTLMDVIEYRPKLFARNNMVVPTLSMFMDMIAREDSSAAGSLFNFPHTDGILEEEDDDEDFEEDKIDVQKLSQTIIDTMAIHIPSKYFTETVLTMISQGMASANPQMRKAGCAVLGVIAEGCHEKLKESLDEILPPLLRSVEDPEYYVRECACFALGQFSEYCQPEILNYHDSVLPVVFKALDDQRPSIQGTSCYVLEYFCESLLPETLRPYLNVLMSKLAALAVSSHKGTQEMALSAIAATAIAAEHDFLPYTEGVCGYLNQLLFVTEPTAFTIRGKALDCLGHIAIAIGDKDFAPYYEMGMRSTIQGIQLDNELLKEHSFVFIANISKVVGKNFEAHMPGLVTCIFSVIEESEIMRLEDVDDDEDGGVDEGADDDDEDGSEDYGDYRLNVMEGFINTKKAAITAAGALAEHTGQAFTPYLVKAMELIVTKDIGVVASYHEEIRAEGATILQFFVENACQAANVKQPAKNEVIELNPAVGAIVKSTLETCLEIVAIDEEKLPVAYALDTINSVLKRIGIVALHMQTAANHPFANVILETILTLLSEKAPCQTTGKEATAAEDNDDDDHDHLVIDGVADLIGVLATLIGPDFVQYFDKFHPLLMKFTKPARSAADRIMAVGCYGEVFDEIGVASLKYVDAILPVIQVSLSDPVENVRRNAAYCVGTLVEKTERALTPHFLHILQWLHPICIRNEKQKTDYVGGADVDNAIAAVARMIYSAPDAVPISHVLPILVNSLPLRNDLNEGSVVFGCLLKLIQNNDATALSMLPQLLVAFGENVKPGSKAEDDTKVVVSEAFKFFAASSQYAPLFQSYVGSLSELERQAVQAVMQI